jgi:hypothetical protein
MDIRNKIFNQNLPVDNDDKITGEDYEIVTEIINNMLDNITEQAVKENMTKNNTKKEQTQNDEIKNTQNIKEFKLDFDNNCISSGDRKYYIRKFVSDTGICLTRLIEPVNKYKTIHEFSTNYLKGKNHKILNDDMLMYEDKNKIKRIIKIFKPTDLIKPYYKFINIKYADQSEEIKQITDLLKLDQFTNGQAYFEFELKAEIIDHDKEREYVVFEEVLDFLYDLNKMELKTLFKEYIKLDNDYLVTCAMNGSFKKIYITDYSKTKRIYNL